METNFLHPIYLKQTSFDEQHSQRKEDGRAMPFLQSTNRTSSKSYVVLEYIVNFTHDHLVDNYTSYIFGHLHCNLSSFKDVSFAKYF